MIRTSLLWNESPLDSHTLPVLLRAVLSSCNTMAVYNARFSVLSSNAVPRPDGPRRSRLLLRLRGCGCAISAWAGSLPKALCRQRGNFQFPVTTFKNAWLGCLSEGDDRMTTGNKCQATRIRKCHRKMATCGRRAVLGAYAQPQARLFRIGRWQNWRRL